MEEQREERDIQREKGEATRRRRWEQRQERKRLAAQKQEEENRQRRRMDEAFMKEALRQAEKAAALGDVPIGCVIVSQGKIIARGYNRRNADKSVLSHAELIAIRKACRKMNRLAAGGLYDIYYSGALPYVRGSHCSGADSAGGDREQESQSRLCRIGAGSSA